MDVRPYCKTKNGLNGRRTSITMLMPLDKKMYNSDMFRDRAVWRMKFAWRPVRCYVSNRWIWLELSYKGCAMWFGPGEPAIEYRWVKSDEYLVAKIKGIL